jgi:tetratricopeptide (TPR) repeat protein
VTGARHLALLIVAATVVTGCRRVGDHERRGDEAYGQSRFSDALGEYRLALANDPEPRLWAKTGSAALRTGNLEVAADAYLRLAAEDPSRAEEAAEGLEAVARAAERSNDVKRLESAVIGLGMIAPNRSLGRYALAVVRRPGAEATNLVNILPAAIATAPDAETVDSLLAVYGAALYETSGCDQALPLYQAAVRRTKSSHLRGRAEDGVAELWFTAAIRVDSATPVGRRALVGYGDAQLRLGDTAAAASAYESVVADLVQSDSTTQMARDRLEELRARAFTGPHTILR